MDVTQYETLSNQYIMDLKEFNITDLESKRGTVKKLVDVTRKLINAGALDKLNKQDLSLYIHQKLLDHQIQFPRDGYFYSLFDDNEKREYGTKSISVTHRNHVHEFNKLDQFTSKCDCGMIQVLGLTYEPFFEPVDVPEKNISLGPVMDETETETKKKKDPYENKTTEYFTRVFFNAEELGIMAQDFVRKYYSNEDVAKAMDSVVEKKADSLIGKQKDMEAKLLSIKRLADFRQKWGEFEKVKAIILEETAYNTAKVAKLMGITPKHLTNNIIRNLQTYLSNMNWFRSITLICKKCKAKNDYEIADWYNEQIERKHLDLTMLQPN